MAFVKPFMDRAGLDSKTAAKRRPATAAPALATAREQKQGDYNDLFLRWNFSPRMERKGEIQMLYGHNVNMASLNNGPAEPFRPIPGMRVRTTADLRKEALELFRAYDKDDNKSLDVVEFKKMLRDAGLGGDLNFREFSEYVKRDFATIDTDGNHNVDQAEFVSYYLYANRHRDPEGHGRGAPGLLLTGKGSKGKGRSGAGDGGGSKDAEGGGSGMSLEMKRKLAILRNHVHSDYHYTPFSKICWLKKTLQAQTKNMSASADFKLMSLDEACHVGSVMAAQHCVEERGETVCFGGVPPIVRATANLHYDLVLYLVMNKSLDKTLLDSEREYVANCCRRQDKEGLMATMRDLYTHSMKRTKIVDAMLNEDIEAAREGFKKVYFSHLGQKSAPRTKNLGITAMKDSELNNKLGERLVQLCQQGITKLPEIEDIIQSGVNVNWRDKNGSTAIMAASWNGDIPIIERLITGGGKVHTVNRRLNTPMHFAAEKHHIELVYVFLKNGGYESLKCKNSIGRKPIQLCKSPYLQEILGQAEIAVDELNRLKKNADFHNQELQATNKDGYIGKGDDWISKACREGDLKALKVHVASNMGSVHTRDKFGMCPLMHAVYGGHMRLVKYLLRELKVDAMALSKNGNTAMHYAFERLKTAKNSASLQAKWQRVIRFLVENGAEAALVTPNRFGQLPEDFELVSAAKASRLAFDEGRPGEGDQEEGAATASPAGTTSVLAALHQRKKAAGELPPTEAPSGARRGRARIGRAGKAAQAAAASHVRRQGRSGSKLPAAPQQRPATAQASLSTAGHRGSRSSANGGSGSAVPPARGATGSSSGGSSSSSGGGSSSSGSSADRRTGAAATSRAAAASSTRGGGRGGAAASSEGGRHARPAAHKPQTGRPHRGGFPSTSRAARTARNGSGTTTRGSSGSGSSSHGGARRSSQQRPSRPRPRLKPVDRN